MGEEEADKIQEPVKNAHKEAKDVALSLEEKRVIFGQHLRTTREELYQTKKDVIHLTRISPPFIEALEAGKFDALPGEVFGRGFVKNICKVLEVDSTSLLEEYNQCWEHKQVKTRSYGYSRRLSANRKDHKSKKSLPFTNYFSPKGIFLWVLGPVMLLSISLSVYLGTNYFGGDSYEKKTSIEDLGAQQKQNLTEDGNLIIPAEEHSTIPNSEIQNEIPPDSQIDAKRSQSIGSGLGSKSSSANQANNEDQKKSISAPPSEPKQTTPIIEVAAKGLSLENNGQQSSYLMVLVKETTTIKHRFDEDSYESKEYEKGLYKFRFKEKIDLFCDDMSKLEVTFNGRKLGDFGINRDAKQLSFIGNASNSKNL